MHKGFGKQNTPQNTPHLVLQTIISDGKQMEVLLSSSSDYEKCPLCGDIHKEIGKNCHWCFIENEFDEE